MTDSHAKKNHLIQFHAALYQEVMVRFRYALSVDPAKRLKPSDADYLFLIGETLKRLTREEQALLHNDFLSPLSKNWWMEYYSKSTYYRLRHCAVDRFLHCLHHEKML